MNTPQSAPAGGSKFHIPTWAAVTGGVLLLLALCLLAYQAGCRRQVAPPTTSAPAALTSPVAIAQASARPSLAASPGPGEATAAPQALPATPSPSAEGECSYPPGWMVYTVQPLDTLFSLARRSGTTLEQVKIGNCLENDLILIGQKLRLPSLPLPPTAAPPQAAPLPAAPAQPTQGGSAPTEVSPEPQSQGQMPVLEIAAIGNLDYTWFSLPGGSPGDPNFKPCGEQPRPTPWIDTPLSTSQSRNIGEHAYFYACDFPPASDLKAEVNGPSAAFSIYTAEKMPYPKWNMGRASKMIVWDLVPCDLAEGTYTLLVSDSQGLSAQTTIQVKKARRSQLLISPNFGDPAQKNFTLYVCTPSQVQQAELGIFYLSDQLDSHGNPLYKPFSTLKGIDIGSNGLAPFQIKFPTSPLNDYAIQHITGNAPYPTDLLWLNTP
jgi:LysM repeat protein